MKFYFNEIGFLKAWPDQINDVMMEIGDLSKLLNGTKFLAKNSFLNDLANKISFLDKLWLVYQLWSYLTPITDSDVSQARELSTTPKITDLKAIELFGYCLRDMQKTIISTTNDQVLIEKSYTVHSDIIDFFVKNIRGKDELEHYLRHNPPCKLIRDVFMRANKYCPKLEFSKKAYATAKKKEHDYRNFGYEETLDLLMAVEKIIYPWCKNKQNKITEKEKQKIFKEETGVEFSPDTTETLKMYGKEREVLIDDTKYTFSYHLKPTDDIRIYFKYISKFDKILIGHAGKHLNTVSRRS